MAHSSQTQRRLGLLGSALVLSMASCADGQLISDFIEPPPPKALTLAVDASARTSQVPYASPEALIDSASISLSGRNSDTTSWVATNIHPWITLLDTAGVGSGKVRWRRQATTFPPGVYVDSIRIVVPGAIGSPSVIVDTLIVSPAPPTAFALAVSPTSRFVRAPSAATFLTDSATVEQQGTLSSNTAWFASKAATWNSLTTANGVGSGTVRWVRDLRDLGPGIHVDTIVVLAGGISRSVVDSVLVPAPQIPPRICLGSASTRDSVGVGSAGERPDSVEVSVIGSDPDAEWQVENRLTSTTLVTPTGRGAGFIRFVRKPSGLAEGVHVDSIWVSLKNDRGNGRRLVDTLKIGPVPEPLAIQLISNRSRTRTVPVGTTTTFVDSAQVRLGGDRSTAATWTAVKTSLTTVLLRATGRGTGYAVWSRSALGLAPGVYVDTVSATAPGALGSPARLIDSLVVIGAPEPIRLSVTPRSRLRTVLLGSGAAVADSATVTMTGSGADRAPWVASKKKNWVQLTQFNGLGAGQVRWIRNPAGLPAGVYVDTIEVSPQGAPSAGVALLDSLVVSPTPPPPPPPPPPPTGLAITIAPPSAYDAVVQGTVAPRSASAQVTVTGTDAAAAQWTAAKRKAWTTLGSAGGTGSGPLAWQRTASGLAPGFYVDTITVTLPGATGSPIQVLDTLRVTQAADTTAGVGEAPSPTGRNPKVVWTKKRQFTWNKMRAENHPWWKLMLSNADKTGTAAERYADDGEWATLVYQVTGNPAYGRKAWAKIRTDVLPRPLSGNGVRGLFVNLVLMYDWLYPILSPAERDQIIDKLNSLGDYALALNTTGYEGGSSTTDSDATVGYYFGLALLDVATAPDNPRAGTWLKQKDRRNGVSVGGLVATGLDRSTLRNAIAQYVTEEAAGGEWFESSMYNPGTQENLLLGAEGVRTATGTDYFPEITQYAPDAALAQAYLITPDLKQIIQWGDEEHPRSFVGRLFRHVTAMAQMAGLARGTAGGRATSSMIDDLVSKYGAVGYGTAEPWAATFFLYDPYAPRTDWRALPPMHFSPGIGHMKVRQDASLFSARFANRTYAHHQLKYTGNFQLYRNGEWAITNPIGYGNEPVSGPAANTVLLAGHGAMSNRQVTAVQTGSGWWAITGRTWGNLYEPGYYDAPPDFVTDWTRTIVYLKEAGADVIVTMDSATVANPVNLPKFSRYRPEDQTIARNAEANVQWLIHAPVSPALSAKSMSWKTAGGQPVVVHTLLPVDQARSVINETTLWSTGAFSGSEKKFQVRIRATSAANTQVFLNVIVVGSASFTPTFTGGKLQVGSRTIQFTGGQAVVGR